MYRVTLESLLGLRLEAGRRLRLRPRVPDAWPGFRVAWRVPDDLDIPGAPAGARAGQPLSETWYEVVVSNPHGRAAAVAAAAADGEPLAVEAGACSLPIVRDGRRHRVEVVLGPAGPEAA
jgi:cyclic beta-1,2-glucan synthetase